MDQLPQYPARDRKVVLVGITRLLTQSERMVQDPALAALARAGVPLDARNAHACTPLAFTTKQVVPEYTTLSYRRAYPRFLRSSATSVLRDGQMKNTTCLLSLNRLLPTKLRCLRHWTRALV